MKKRHLILIDSELKGREYGTLNAFNEAIIKITSGDTLILPKKTKFENRFFQSSNFRCLRKFSRKTNLKNITENKYRYGVIFSFKEVSFNPKNYLKPFVEKIVHKLLYLHYNTQTGYFIEFKKYETNTDDNIFSSNSVLIFSLS